MKEILWSALRGNREAFLWKLEGLGEYDLRRPMTRTGTNLLGVVKHVAAEEYGYLGETFGRPAPERLACFEDGTVWEGGDMWATPEESAEYIKGFYRRASAHADETIRTLDLDSVGSVPWWDEDRRKTTLGAIMAMMINETSRHLGQVDIVREMIDGTAGGQRNATGLPDAADWDWEAWVARLESAARAAAER
ncbi:DinB family protein [Microlunatus parietis]|uniref:Putative damage-inducible protein DinB n=1 Tax=Microlunatus parietis TaxID=682979 RepID=A0A7Y9I7C4_9ACTN|nr:DinB family protein [Microlunatus parietis]NYE71331.1 putative damage-inducible protein DinB [Microlunatus parietis]